MGRTKWEEPKKTPAQIAWENDMIEARKVWDLLSHSQQERFAMADSANRRFMECLAHLCVEFMNTKR